MPAIILSRIAGSAHLSLAPDALLWRTTGSESPARMSAIIFSRVTGSAHRAFVASLIFARRAGLLSAVRIFASIAGSAHSAFEMARRRSSISGVTARRRGSVEVCLICFRLQKGETGKGIQLTRSH
jgi:hypothetical protein